MNTDRTTVTGSIETDANPEAILEVLSDPRRLPKWAPGFADRIETDETGRWNVTKGDKTFPIDVVEVASARTVDYLREVAPGKKAGAFIRVLPRLRGGSVIVMTLPIVPGTSAEETTAILDDELQALTRLSAS